MLLDCIKISNFDKCSPTKSTKRSLIAHVKVQNMDKSNRFQPLDPEPISKAHYLKPQKFP
jgi:hypothetical protein